MRLAAYADYGLRIVMRLTDQQAGIDDAVPTVQIASEFTTAECFGTDDGHCLLKLRCHLEPQIAAD